MHRSWSRAGNEREQRREGKVVTIPSAPCTDNACDRRRVVALKPLSGPHPLDFRSLKENPSVLHAGLCVRRYLPAPCVCNPGVQ